MKNYGGGFGDWIKKISRWIKPVIKFLQDSKVISSGVGLIPHPIAQTISSGAKALGFGEGGQALSRNELMRRVRSYK